jgi:hypothetical protein
LFREGKLEWRGEERSFEAVEVWRCGGEEGGDGVDPGEGELLEGGERRREGGVEAMWLE